MIYKPCQTFSADTLDEDMCKHCGWDEASHIADSRQSGRPATDAEFQDAAKHVIEKHRGALEKLGPE